jgi:hypothetical protein
MIQYKNRKIYNSENKSYLNIPEAAQLCALNPELRVISKETGADVTKNVLYSAINLLTKRLIKRAKREELSDLLIDTAKAVETIERGEN